MRVIAEFAKLHVLLTEEEQLFLQGLRQEEEETKKKQSENIFRLNQMITSLKTLILEVKEKSQGSTLELLQVRPAGAGIVSVFLDLLTSLTHLPLVFGVSFLVSGFSRRHVFFSFANCVTIFII